jgi:peroxiredoxin
MATSQAAAAAPPKDTVGLALKIGLAVLVAAFLFVVSGTLQQRVIEQGDKAPSFTVTTDQGQKLGPADFKGKLLVLNFWATWCAPCVEEVPSLSDFAKKYGNDVTVLGVSVDRNENLYRGFVQRNKVAFQTARDPDANISGSYGTFKYPETYIIDRNGKVIQKIIGPQNWTDPAYLNYFQSLL